MQSLNFMNLLDKVLIHFTGNCIHFIGSSTGFELLDIKIAQRIG